jgi:hypothetical protein
MPQQEYGAMAINLERKAGQSGPRMPGVMMGGQFITNANATVTTMVPTTAVGILLAPNNNINTMDSTSFTGEVIGGYRHTVILMSATKVTNPCQP